MTLKRLLAFALICALAASCSRFGQKDTKTGAQRIVCIGEQYNEFIYALGAQDNLVGVDYSSTYPPEIKKLTTVGYHRALSAEGILSLHPTIIIDDDNIGPENVVRQLKQLGIPMKTFAAKDDSIEGAKALLREMGAYFHKEQRAEELCAKIDKDMAAAAEMVKQYTDHPRVAVIHFGRASNVYMVVGTGGGGDAGSAGQMVEWAGGVMAIQKKGMQRMASPEVVAASNPDVMLMTEYGFDRLGSADAAKTLPGVAETDAAKNNRIYRVTEHELMYYGPDTGENVMQLARLIHTGASGQ
ncbi:MAG TPA: ABC transporter substrate-binding protein [Vicinamibacterales bacterium]